MRLVHSIISINFLLCLCLHPLIGLAQEGDSQTGEIAIDPGHITIATPEDFSLGTIFFSTTEQTVQKILDPHVTSETVMVTDLRRNGEFSVDVRISDLVSGPEEDAIPYQNIDILTLSVDTGSSVDIDSVIETDMMAPLDYNWDFSSVIPSSAFTDLPIGVGGVSGPITIMNGDDPLIDDYFGQFSVGMGFLITVPADSPTGSYEGELLVTLNL